MSTTTSRASSFGDRQADRRRRARRRLCRGRPRRRPGGRSCCTAGRTTSTATSTSPRCWRRRGTGRSSRTCAGTGRRASCRTRRSATASRRRSRSTRSPCWTRSRSRRAIVAGFDWGARTADIVAALWPERCNGLVSVSGYLIGSQAAGKLPLPPEAELQWWYQYYFATERGRAGYDEVPARVREAHLADRVAEVGLRRRHLRSQRRVLRQPRSRRRS